MIFIGFCRTSLLMRGKEGREGLPQVPACQKVYFFQSNEVNNVINGIQLFLASMQRLF